MNNTYYNGTGEYEIDLANVLWKLLSQWKAVLIVCIIMALLVPSAMYAKGKKAYDALLEEQAEEEAKAAKSPDERIGEILAELPSEDVSTIRFILQQQELIDLQNNYLKNSVWVNTNPTSQRNLNIRYFLKRVDDIDMQLLKDSYYTCLRRTKSIKKLRDVISPDSPVEFMYELIGTSGGEVVDSDVDSVVYTVNIVLPEDADTNKVLNVVDENIKNVNEELKESLGEHSISRFNVEELRQYNSGVADRRTNTSYAINNLTNNINAAKERVTAESKEAMEEVIALKRESTGALDEGSGTSTSHKASKSTNAAASKEDKKTGADEEDDENVLIGANGEEVREPSFSKKYAVLGFILGAFLYAGAYLVLIVLRKNVESPSSVTSFTGARVLGEIYNMAEHKGISKLLHSDRVIKIRYKGRGDAETQMSKAINSIDAVSEHAGAKEITVFSFKDSSETYESVLDNLAAGLKKKGIKSETEDIEEDVDEKSLLGVKNAILAVSSKTKADKLAKLAALCRDYDVNLLGSVYTEEI